MSTTSREVSIIGQVEVSMDARQQTLRAHGSRLMSARRVITFAALALLCSLSPAVMAQTAAIPGGYLQLFPASATMTQGQTVQLRAAVMNPLGFELPNRQVTWKSSNTAVAGVSSAGLVTAVKPGTVTITAKSGAALGTTTVVVSGAPVNTPPAVSITSPADATTFQQAASITFTATATDLQSGNLSSLIVWTAASAADPNGAQQQLGTGASIATNSLAPGSYLITASSTDSGGLTGIAQAGIIVQAPCVQFAKILPEPGAKIPQLLQLDATQSYDSCGRQLKYIWFFSSDTSLEGPTFLAQANTPGNTNATPVLNLQEFDVIVISLQVCLVGTTECSTAPNPQAGIWDYGRIYEGASI